MIDLASALTLPLAKLLLKSWLGDTAADIGDNLLKLALNRLGDRTKARAAQQRANQIAKGVVADLSRFFAAEHDEDGLEAAAFDLGETIGHHVNAKFLVSKQLADSDIREGLLEARPIDEIYKSAEPERALYVRLIKALAPRLRAVAPELPGYELERDAALLRMTKVADGVAETLAAIRPAVEETARKVDMILKRPESESEKYTFDYLDALCTELNRVELIGLTVDAAARRGDLEVAYLPLRTRLGVHGETRQADFATLMTLLPELGNRILIEGPAGAGKSTLLRWAAIQAGQYRLQAGTDDPLAIASDLDSWLGLFLPEGQRFREAKPAALTREEDERSEPHRALRKRLSDACWRSRVPFFVPLRRTREKLDLDGLPKLILGTIEEPPDGWASAQVKDALLLIDGVDEVPAGAEREAALAAVQTWAKRFPNAQMVVTSRPGAVPEGALANFTSVRVDELDDEQKIRFVDHWHRALGRQLGWPDDHPLLAQLAKGVQVEFERQRALQELAANPLLCASISALHWDRRRDAARAAFKNNETLELGTNILPDTRWRLCDALTEMLLERREREQPDFYTKDFPPEYQLAYEQKATILSEVAWAMVEDDMRSTATRKNAETAIRRALRSRRERVKAKAPAILKALVERSGNVERRGRGRDRIRP